jgi:hypothetical protein
MPHCIACPICQKTGFLKASNGKTIECPACGSSARREFQIPDFIRQSGWTTQEAVNAYFLKLISQEVEIELSRHMAIFKSNNPNASNRQVKERSKILESILFRESSHKYPNYKP